MYVVNDLWMPNIMNLIDGDLRLDLRERIPVSIVRGRRTFVSSGGSVLVRCVEFCRTSS